MLLFWIGFDYGICKPKTIGEDGNVCPEHCPRSCLSDQYHCAGAFDQNRCQMEESCLPHEYDTFGQICPNICPVTCSPEDLFCNSHIVKHPGPI